MNKQEENTFIDIVKFSPEHHYEVLGLIPFSAFNKTNFQERYRFAKNQFSREDTLKAHRMLSKARTHLASKTNKHKYDVELRLRFERNLKDLIKNFVEKDKKLVPHERETVEQKGNYFGFSPSTIKRIIEEQRTRYSFEDDAVDLEQITATSANTKAGFPLLEIFTGKTLDKNHAHTFENVSLTRKKRKVITIKNGGGGTLEAEAIFSAEWIDVIPRKIHQKKLPQEVIIEVDPSKVKSLKGGNVLKDTIDLTYISSGGAVHVPISIKMTIEGHNAIVKKLSRYASLISGVIVGVVLLYFFLNYSFSGWEIFVFLVSIGMIGRALLDSIENREGLTFLSMGGVLLLTTNWTIFALIFTVIVTWYTSRFFFSKKPFFNSLVVAIPIASFLLFLLLFFGFSDLPQSHAKTFLTRTKPAYNYRPVNLNSGIMPSYNAIVPIYKNAYISANPFANIREGNYADRDLITYICKGKKIFVIEQDKATGWYKIRFNDFYYGYISNQVVSLEYVPENSKGKTKLITKLLIGNWKINNGVSNYTFRSNGSGYYKNGNDNKISFTWQVSKSYLVLTSTSDKSVEHWKINAFSKNKFKTRHSKENINRVLTN